MFLLINAAAAYTRRTRLHHPVKTNGLAVDRWTETTPMKVLEASGNIDIKDYFTADPNFILSLQSTYPNNDAQAISNKMKFSSRSNTVYYKINFVGEATSKVRTSTLDGTQVAFRKEDGGLFHIVVTDSHARGSIEAYAYDVEKKYYKAGIIKKTFHYRSNERWRPLSPDEINQVKNILQQQPGTFESNPFYT